MTERSLAVLAPICGWCDSLADNPDPVFSSRTLGDGVSIDPTDGTVTAPFDGEILTLPASAHAVSLRSENGAEVLIHFGIDTVALSGDGFEAHVKQGDRVRCGQRLLSVALDQVLRRVPSLRSPVLLLNGDRFEMGAVRSPGMVARDDAIFELRRRAGTDAPVTVTGSRAAITRELVVGLEHGLHARPAAAVIDVLRHFEAEVEIRSAGGGRASARSAVSMMALGIGHGEALTIAAHGPDAEAVLQAIVPLLRPLPVTRTHASTDVRRSRPVVEVPAAGSVLRAKSASVGLAFGPAARLDAPVAIPEGPAGQPAEERKRLDHAVASVRASLEAMADGRGDAGRDIARAHLAMLEDPAILDAARDRIGHGDSAAFAWHSAVRECSEALSKLGDRRMRERVDDLVDIDQRVLRVLAGQPDARRELPASAIVIADNLLPSQLLALEPDSFAGICTAAGGVTSHVAILAASLGKPMLVAAGESVLRIDDGTIVCVDADNGELRVAPEPEAVAAYRRRVVAEGTRRQHELATAAEPCVLADGSTVHVLANMASVDDARDALRLGADGCGLFRTEFLFMGQLAPPGASEQLAAYRQVAEALGDRKLIIRLLDVGGDKPIGYIARASEDNPALGVRGVRLTLRHRGLLETQLEALCRLSRLRPVDIMIPMVTSVDEVQAVRSILAAASERMGRTHVVRLGIMIETPAAALVADRLARVADFFSIGTNDLTQYTLAMDRGDPAFAGPLDALQPAVLQLIAQTAAAARDAGIPVGVCGAAAGDREAAIVLLGYGIRELSMVPSAIPRLKATLRGVDPAVCRLQASAALGMSSAAEVRASVRELLLREKSA